MVVKKHVSEICQKLLPTFSRKSHNTKNWKIRYISQVKGTKNRENQMNNLNNQLA